MNHDIRRCPQFSDYAIKMLLPRAKGPAFSEDELTALAAEGQALRLRMIRNDKGEHVATGVIHSSPYVGGPVDDNQ
jgi:hypothetical protein